MKESKELQAINNQIECLRKENKGLYNTIYGNEKEIDTLLDKQKKLKAKTLKEWYNTHPLTKYYKKEYANDNFHTTYYINIVDEKVEQYNGNIQEIIKVNPFLDTKQVGLIYDVPLKKMGKVEYLGEYSVHLDEFSPTYDRCPGESEWQAISENEYLKAKDIAINYIKNN